MPDNATKGRSFLVRFKTEVDAQWAATVLGAAHADVVSVGAVDERVAEQARKMQARAASAKPQPREMSGA